MLVSVMLGVISLWAILMFCQERIKHPGIKRLYTVHDVPSSSPGLICSSDLAAAEKLGSFAQFCFQALVP